MEIFLVSIKLHGKLFIFSERKNFSYYVKEFIMCLKFETYSMEKKIR